MEEAIIGWSTLILFAMIVFGLVAWVINKKVVNKGIGLYDLRTNTFAAGYAIGSSPGVAIFQLSKKNKQMDCVGTFEKMIGKVAYESWKRKKK